MKPEEQARKDSFESWGYTVTLIEDTDNQATYNTQAALHDVIYVSEHAKLDDEEDVKFADLAIGVVNEQGKINDDLGMASGKAEVVGSSIIMVDTSHYISQIFSPATLEIYADSSAARIRGNTSNGRMRSIDSAPE